MVRVCHREGKKTTSILTKHYQHETKLLDNAIKDVTLFSGGGNPQFKQRLIQHIIITAKIMRIILTIKPFALKFAVRNIVISTFHFFIYFKVLRLSIYLVFYNNLYLPFLYLTSMYIPWIIVRISISLYICLTLNIYSYE